MYIKNFKGAIFIAVFGILGISGCTNQPRYENWVCQSLPQEKNYVKDGVYVSEKHYLYTPDVNVKEALAILIAKVENMEKTLYGKNIPNNTLIKIEPDINDRLDEMLPKVKATDIKPTPAVSYKKMSKKTVAKKAAYVKKKSTAKEKKYFIFQPVRESKVFESMSINSRVLYRIGTSSKIYLKCSSNGWCKVKDLKGYVLKNNLKKIGE